jgi:hypothetical protein
MPWEDLEEDLAELFGELTEPGQSDLRALKQVLGMDSTIGFRTFNKRSSLLSEPVAGQPKQEYLYPKRGPDRLRCKCGRAMRPRAAKTKHDLHLCFKCRGVWKICKWCKKEFRRSVNTRGRPYCSQTCRSAQWRSRYV